MAYDLASQPWTPGHTQICGDAHLSNFGVFGSPERDLVFDLNDFDETLPGPFEWDVKRLVASLVLAARDRGFRRKEARQAVRSALTAYREVIADLARRGHSRCLVRQDRRAAAARGNRRDGPRQARAARCRASRAGHLRGGAAQDLDAGGAEAHRVRRRSSAVPRGPTIAVPGGYHAGVPRPGISCIRRLPRHAAGRPTPADRALPARRRRGEGGRRGQRRHASRDPSACTAATPTTR